ncbi:MAG TPA: SIS domain-containing protein [Longimicrobiales bacterium]|nr:SIS domain-containing protein [Longimicrobiales bacterium]
MESALLRNAAVTHLSELAQTARMVSEQLLDEIVRVSSITYDCLTSGHKLMYCGNGGSAADAQHIATEYVVRFRRNRAPLAAMALTTDTSLLTAASNDFSFDQVFERQVEALGLPGDILFLHSTSGESENLLLAADAARSSDIITIALLARGGGRLAARVDHKLVVPTDNGAHAQELHLAISHIICDLVEQRFVNA